LAARTDGCGACLRGDVVSTGLLVVVDAGGCVGPSCDRCKLYRCFASLCFLREAVAVFSLPSSSSRPLTHAEASAVPVPFFLHALSPGPASFRAGGQEENLGGSFGYPIQQTQPIVRPPPLALFCGSCGGCHQQREPMLQASTRLPVNFAPGGSQWREVRLGYRGAHAYRGP
jgi:hypothetical protein